MDRREFIRDMAALGLEGGGGGLVLAEEVWAMAPQKTPQPLVAKVQGANYAQITGDAIQALGGMKKFVNPGEYKLRILFDDNRNGIWDPGDYSKKLQPEKVITLKEKLGVRGNWDNERDIKL